MTESKLDIFPLRTIHGDDLSAIVYARHCHTYPHLVSGTSIMLENHAQLLTKNITPGGSEYQCERLYVESDVKKFAAQKQIAEDAAILLEENKTLLEKIDDINRDRELLEKHLVARIGTIELQHLRNNARKK